MKRRYGQSHTSLTANKTSGRNGLAGMRCSWFRHLQWRHCGHGREPKVMGQSIVLSEIKTEVPLDNDDPAYQKFVLQQFEERIERHTQPDKVSKFCMDAGFLSVVEIGQYFMTKGHWRTILCQWPVVNTLFQEMMDHHNQEDGSRETQKLDPCWKVRPVACMANHGVEIRIWSLSEDNTHTRVRIAHWIK